MLNNPIHEGQRFEWKNTCDDGFSGNAIVKAVRSNQEEGMSSEIQDYASAWIEAEGQSGSREHEIFTILLNTDGKSYIDGQQISIKIA